MPATEFALDRAGRVLFHGAHAYVPAARRWQRGEAAAAAEPIDPVAALMWVQAESGHPLRAPVGVIGPNEATTAQNDVAEQVGRLLGGLRLTLICGGRQGVMESACRGAAAVGGLTIGVLPHGDPDLANPFVAVPIASGIGEARNAIIAQAGACLICVGDSYGTLSEVALGLRLGKAVFGLAGAATIEGVIQVADPAALGPLLARHLLAAPSPS